MLGHTGVYWGILGYTGAYWSILGYTGATLHGSVFHVSESDPLPKGGDSATGLTILHYACTLGDDVIVTKLLKEHPCDLGAADKPETVTLKFVSYWWNVATAEWGLQARVWSPLEILKFLYDYAPSVVPNITLAKECVLDTPTLLHLAALNNHTEVVEFLKQRLFPPIGRYKLVLDYNALNSQDMFPEDMANLRGNASLRGKLSDYRKQQELRWWLSFIKARPLVQVPFVANSTESGNYVPMCTSVRPEQQPPRRPLSSGTPGGGERASSLRMPCFAVCPPGPRGVIGSHYDLLSPELQPQYPRVAMMIVNRLERLKSEQPKLKVIVWEQFVEIMHNDVNRLITERQLSYLCKCLANAGVILSYDRGRVGVMDKGCSGQLRFHRPPVVVPRRVGEGPGARGVPPGPNRASAGPPIKEEVIKARLAEHMDTNHVTVILELLQRFDLCHLDKRKKTYLFPSFSKLLRLTLWQPDNGLHYIGRRLSCEDETDTFPPGFLSPPPGSGLQAASDGPGHAHVRELLFGGGGWIPVPAGEADR
eukprot:Em1135g1a